MTGSIEINGVPGFSGQFMSVAPKNLDLYVIGDNGKTISRVNQATLEVTSQTTLDFATYYIATPAWTDSVIVYDQSGGILHFLNPDTLEPQRQLSPGFAWSAVVDPVRPRIYVVPPGDPVITILDGVTGQPVASLPRLPGSTVSATDIWASPNGRYLMWYVNGFLTVGDIDSGQIVATHKGFLRAAPSSDWSRVFTATQREPWKVTTLSFPELEVQPSRSFEQPVSAADKRDVVRAYRGGLMPTDDGKYLMSLGMTQRGSTDMFVFDLKNPKRVIRSRLPINTAGFTQGAQPAFAWLSGFEDGSVLRIDLAPARPGRLVSVAEGVPGGATVSWGSRGGPWVPGAARVTAVASPGGRSCSSEGSACTIAGLDRGQRYSIRVWAENVAGKGPVARTSVRVPDVKPPRRPVVPEPEGKPEQAVS